MRLKRAFDIELDDLPKIENPFFAVSDVRSDFYSKEIWGLDEILYDEFSGTHHSREAAFKKLLECVEEGSIFLLKDDPFSPVVRWVEEEGHPLKGKWIPEECLDIPVDFYVENAVSSAQSHAMLKIRAIEYEKERVQLKRYAIGKTAQKPIEKDAKPVDSDIEVIISKAVLNSHSVAEALGKAGMEQAKIRLGYTTDPRYIDRYHGPDDVTNHNKTKRFAEMESKANKTDSKAVAVDSKGDKQGSSSKNKRRATVMTKDKVKKIGVSSNRQGGAYTQDEIDLWKEIKERDGNKQHISVHTNTETGNVKVIERNFKGNPTKTLDEFKMKNFDEIKNGIKKVIKK